MVLLQRIACGDHLLASAFSQIGTMFTPLGLRQRNTPPKYTTLTPLTNFPDALQPDPQAPRIFAVLLSKALRGDTQAKTKAKHLLTSWSRAAATLYQSSGETGACSSLHALSTLIESCYQVARAAIAALGFVGKETQNGAAKAASALSDALAGAESEARAFEARMVVGEALHMVGAALGGKDPPPGGYINSCRECEFTVASLTCSCSSRSGFGKNSVLERPFECAAPPGIDNQDGCLVCVRLDGREERARGC